MKNQEISTLIGQKRAYNSSSFLLYVSKFDINNVKKGQKRSKNIAILVSKKIFKTAVSRNKARRMIRSSINRIFSDISEGNKSLLKEKKIQFNSYNLIFSLKKGFEKVDFKDLIVEIKQSLLKNVII
ncbi:MAG: ribonuclease P protein component [Candidatus Pacebacteria bacterium]|nr:ribonuclease P protein component [Candidatus Paceibacterota bacterium]